jgi:ribosomal protein S18 acetylase RimI-like enzyme
VPQVPDGLRVGTIPDGYERILYEVDNEAFTDHWGFEARPYEQWHAMMFDPDTYRPDLSRLAFDGDEIAAFVICFNGIEGEVYVGDVGTRRPWRKRGLASLLLLTCLRAAEESGLTRARLHVDSDSLTGAVGVYERAGFAVDITNCCYTRPLNP